MKNEPALRDWISVDDELPMLNLVVLVPGGIAEYQCDGTWYTHTGCFPPRQIQWVVTHWMPFPASPQVAANG